MNGNLNRPYLPSDSDRPDDTMSGSIAQNGQQGYQGSQNRTSSSYLGHHNVGGDMYGTDPSTQPSFGRPSPHNLPVGSGAASMLMAANALAQTPAQNVSEALLGQVQIAAEGQILQHRRESAGLTSNVSKQMQEGSEGFDDEHSSNSRRSSIPQYYNSTIPSGQGSRTGFHTLHHPSNPHIPPPFSVHPSSVGIQGSIAKSLHAAAKIGTVQASSASAFSAAQLAPSSVNESSAQQQARTSLQTNDGGFSGMQGGFDGINIGRKASVEMDVIKSDQAPSSAATEAELSTSNPQQQKNPIATMLLASRNLPYNLSQSHSNKSAAEWYAPLSPRTQAQVQVGNIAANVAVHEYIAQTVSSSISKEESNRWYDPNQPFQGVPSTPMMPSPSPAMLPPPDIVMGMRTPFSGSSNTNTTNQTNFVPSYRLAPDEYTILASAAAIATAALTTASTSSLSFLDHDTEMQSKENNEGRNDDDNGNLSGSSSRALTEQEQEEITILLRAWAGLEGIDRQEEARQQLNRTKGARPNSDGSEQSTTQFIPPDFARHFQSQLTALAAGYYQKLHTDGFTQPYFAPSTVESVSILRQQQQHLQQLQQLQQTQQRSSNGQTSLSALGTSNSGSYTIQQNDPMLLMAQASSSTGLSVNSPQLRDQLLQYAHQLYANGGKQIPTNQDEEGMRSKSKKEGDQTQTRTELHPSLLPLLHTLHKIHPRHLPTLLLLSCAYYSCGDLAASLWYNKEILSIDPNYVESMSNIGTTLRALGRWHEAESWWLRAVKLRPGYWDAYENLLGVLCSPQQISPSKEEHAAANRVAEIGQLPLTDDQMIAPKDRKPQTGSPRFQEALKLCEFVESNVLSKRQQSSDEGRMRKVPGSGAIASFENAPVYMPMHLPVAQGPRLQNLFYAKGNLKYVLPDLGAVPAAREYERSIEMMLSTSENNAYSTRDLILSTYVIGVLTMGIALPGSHAAHALSEIAQAIGLNLQDSQQIQQAAAGQYHLLCPGGGILRLVRKAGDALLHTLLRLGGGSQLPLLMMLPQGAMQLASILFAETEQSLPALVEACRRAVQSVDTIQSTLQQAQTMTSTVLLTLAKLVQDATTRASTGPHGALTLDGIPPSTSLLLPLYYLSIAVSPAASTANNLGILLSSIPVSTNVASGTGERQNLNGQSLALQYYTYGLTLDPRHPHLYTNFGSLLKDLNHLTEAIQMYEKAIDCNPTFDVALANLGNAIKDQGRTQDSVQYYRRAVEENPNFPEALCGLVNALLAICSWEEVYGESDEGKEGFMARVVELLERQLDEGSLYGAGSLCSDRNAEEWADLIVRMTGRSSPEEKQSYIDRIQMISAMGLDGEREKQKINEGSFVIRLIERIMRRTQREWYLTVYGKKEQSDHHLPRIEPRQEDLQKYKRIPLPACLGTPTVPTVLPFHTFTLKIPPRHIRLISHRTALRISQTTMSQLWLPANVYPPPAPPSPRIKVGYVSSDFNNHPLAHLMQSTFGFHDRSKFEVFLYATSLSDQSPYRKKIEKEAENFLDVSTWTNQMIISRILDDGIHLLMNLNGYTKGARNEIFAARPCPVQLEFMGFAGGMASSWTDWIVVDPIVCPPEMTSTDIWRKERKTGSQRQRRMTDFDGDRDPESMDNDWVYTEHFIYLPDSYFVNDHRQGFREPEQRRGLSGEIVKPHQMNDEEAWREEEKRRWQARKELWPSLPDDFLIFADFNQLYKLEPTLFKLWLRILQRVPNSIIWLLRFPSAGEAHLLRYAQKHFGDEVAARVIFTDVAPKSVHIHRGRIADLFLDTLECGAHTTSADILWSATPVLTWPKHKHKMASRVAASIVAAAGQGDRMIVDSEQAYEDRAVQLAQSLSYTYVDKNGKSLQAKKPKEGQDAIQADALSFNAESSSAAQHNAITFTEQESQQGQKANEVPAPMNVKKAEAESKKEEGKQENLDPLPPRSHIHLTKIGPQAPLGTDSRRSHGELSDLRKELFLSRDSNKLFDTQRWVRHLERGYEEAWKRWVQGIDMEEGKEWHALPEHHPAKQSGHIWVQDESKVE